MANIYNSQLDAYSLYHQTQENHSPALEGPALPALGHALAGSAGTAISNLAIYPLDLVITRLQVQRQLRKASSTPSEGEYIGVLHAFEQIYQKEGGFSSFYSGIWQDTGKSIADSFLFFLFYNYLRSHRLQRNGGTSKYLPVLDELGVGALAGACSKFFTTPIANIVTRKQTAAMISARAGAKSTELSASDIASTIRSEKGIQGFWSGYSASLVLTLNPSITFFLFEFLKRSLLPSSRRDNPGARVTFLMAAFSKSIASAITYPFSLAKARAQTSPSPPINSNSAQKVKDEVENVGTRSEAEKAGRDAKNIAKRSTVFTTILRIYHEEGAAALYEGIFGEILKGFFSHGLTMIVKDAIHKLIIQTYYILLKVLNKYPSPSEVAAQAGEVIQERVEKAGEIVKESYGHVTQRVGEIVQNGRVTIGSGEERVGVMRSNTTEATKVTDDHASKEAGHLLGNAQEQLGGKIEEEGKGIINSTK